MELSSFRLTIDIPEQHEVTYLTFFFFLYLFLELFDSIAICKAN